MKTGGRAAVIVPDGVLFGSSNAHKQIRKELIEKHKLDAVISMPSGVFKTLCWGKLLQYSSLPRQVQVVQITVWFYDMQADGYS